MLHPDATTIRLIHQHMIEEELARHRKPNRDDSGSPRPRRRPSMVLRHVAARELRTVAGWIEPRPPVDRAAPPTTPAV